MVKRAVIVLVCTGFLSGLGMPLSRPCCPLAELSVDSTSPDCCPKPDCCRNEKRGAVPILLVERAAPTLHSPLAAGAFSASWKPLTSPKVVEPVAKIGSVHGPPTISRNLLVFLSTLRV